jgi:hypothetical protein
MTHEWSMIWGGRLLEWAGPVRVRSTGTTPLSPPYTMLAGRHASTLVCRRARALARYEPGPSLRDFAHYACRRTCTRRPITYSLNGHLPGLSFRDAVGQVTTSPNEFLTWHPLPGKGWIVINITQLPRRRRPRDRSVTADTWVTTSVISDRVTVIALSIGYCRG